MRRFLFMAGEWSVSMPLAFADEEWSHTNTARMLIDTGGKIARRGVSESLEGFIYFASVENREVRRHNLLTLSLNNIPCWPNPGKLLRLDDRFAVLKMCVDVGFVDHPVEFFTWEKRRHRTLLKHPYVMKVGNCHQGEGKILVLSEEDEAEVQPFEGIASAEPFFVGTSMRVLFIGQEEFFLQFTNDNSWIKNSAGAEVEVLGNYDQVINGGLHADIYWKMLQHARKVRDYFDLEVCGIDYIVDKRLNVHFLEYNMFPGVGSSEDISEAARKIFRQKMDIVASEANNKR